MSSEDGVGWHSDRMQLVAALIATLIFVLGTTRLFSGFLSRQDTKNQRHPPRLPYWVPYLGHTRQVLKDASQLLHAAARRFPTAPTGSVALNAFGHSYVVFSDPTLAQQELKRREGSSYAAFDSKLSRRAGSIEEWSPLWLALNAGASLFDFIQSEEEFPWLESRLKKRWQEQLPNLVSGCKSPIDQMAWDKAADAELVAATSNSESPTIECDLNILINLSITHLLLEAYLPAAPPDIISSLVQTLTEMNEDQVSAWRDVPTRIGGFVFLASLRRGYKAKRAVFQTLRDYHEALDDFDAGIRLGAKWTALETQDISRTRFGMRRSELKAEGVSARERALVDTYHLFQLSKDVGNFVFWFLMEILTSSPEVKTSWKTETDELVTIEEQPPLMPGSSIAAPPKVTMNDYILKIRDDFATVDSTLTKCIRKRFKGIAFRPLAEPETFETQQNGKLEVPVGTKIGIAWELLLPKLQQPPPEMESFGSTFNDNRVVIPEPPNTQNIFAYLTRDPASRSLSFLRSFVACAVAGILKMWDITPVPESRGWDGRICPPGNWDSFRMPPVKHTAGMDVPAQKLRVRITRRKPSE